ncbi:DUF7507 domain-containing protein [Bauldia sp.]|uniref:DUF7507 domain-containing protein n=1 Tax=Bauldia sp. TaxID=2575872 RepID=UPI003BAD5A64
MAVTTNKSDYSPGEYATITGSVSNGGALRLQVSHVDGPGTDGIFGTGDDYLDAGLNAASSDHSLFVVVDGGWGDLDGEVNGQITVEWYVNPDDSLGERFLVEAQEVEAGADGTLGTSDDIDVGEASFATFTDSLPDPIQTYYIPMPESALFTSFDTINSNASGNVTTLIGISIAAPGTIIYYDHWEDGYEPDITNPTPGGTTEIWGDGDTSNGEAPGIAGDVFVGGETIILENVVLSGVVDDYDGGDRIEASFPIAITRAAYPETPGSLLAGAVEVLSTDDWGTEYIVPVGEDTPDSSGTQPFDYAAIYVMAGSDDTEVMLNGVLQATLDQGESLVINSVNQGDVITAENAITDEPQEIQVQLVTGDPGSTYEMRWYSLTPSDEWTDDYYAPFAEEAGPTGFWFYNPNESEITINYGIEGNANAGSFDVAGKSSKFIEIGNSDGDNIDLDGITGMRFFADEGEEFFALSQIDTDGGGAIYDWGYPLIPSNQLTSQALIGLGYGTTDNDGTAARSVVWVTPVAAATITVDYNGDGSFVQTFDLNALESLQLIDPNDQDMSGALITAVSNEPDTLGEPVNIAVAWGQNPALSFSGDDDALDLGTVVPALPDITAQKNASLFIDNDQDGKFDPGDTIEYTITVLNISPVDIGAGGYNIVDFITPLLDNAIYDPNLGHKVTYTYVTDPGDDKEYGTTDDKTETITIPDNFGVDGTDFPLDGDGYDSTDELSGNSEVEGIRGESHTFTFQVKIKNFEELEPGTKNLVNTGELRINDETYEELEATVPLDFEAKIEIEKATNGSDADTPTGPEITVGGDVVWTYFVKNTGNVLLTDILVTDSDNDVDPIAVVGNEGFNVGDIDKDGILDFDEEWEYEAKGIAEEGPYSNIGTATGKAVYEPEDGEDPVPVEGVEDPKDTDPSHYIGKAPPPVPSYDIIKTVLNVGNDGPDGVADEAGDVIEYQIDVVNTGQVAITDVVLTDDLLQGENGELDDDPTGDNNVNGILDVGETWTYLGQYTVQQVDLDTKGDSADGGDNEDGDIDNIAIVTGKTPDGDLPPKSDHEDVPLVYNPAATIDKTVLDVGGKGPNGIADLADIITYQIVVENTGNITIDDWMLKDDLLQNDANGDLGDLVESGGDPALNDNGILDVGETFTWIGTYEVQQSDIDDQGGGDGDIDNKAIFWSPAGDIKDKVETPLHYCPKIEVDKEVLDVAGQGPKGSVENVGDVITYQITMHNSGNATAFDAIIKDKMLVPPNGELGEVVETGGTGTNNDGHLDPNETWTVIGTYTVTEEDLNTNGGGDGDIDNTGIGWTDFGDVFDSVSTDIGGGVKIKGTKKADKIDKNNGVDGKFATDLGDQIFGRKGNDKIKALAGNDWISGGEGKDKLTGGDGEDRFFFGEKLKSSNKDKITDFEVGIDMIILDSSVFKGLKTGDLKEKYFRVGSKAKDKDHKIIYDKDEGTFAFDQDGKKGGHDAKVFATVGKLSGLDETSFYVV